ncbi:MAG: hypothetical protein WC042_02610 [Candidatus Paceibacterota bacterium]
MGHPESASRRTPVGGATPEPFCHPDPPAGGRQSADEGSLSLSQNNSRLRERFLANARNDNLEN